MVRNRPLRLPFSMRRVASVQRLADAEILLSDTETRCSVSSGQDYNNHMAGPPELDHSGNAVGLSNKLDAEHVHFHDFASAIMINGVMLHRHSVAFM